MLALALFIAAGAPNAAWALLDARSVLRGSNRRLSSANFGQLKLVAADAAEDDIFGHSVAIDGDTIVVGTYYMEAVYVLRTTDGGATYDEVAKLTASDAVNGDKFGRSVAIDGDTIVIGAYEDDDGGTRAGAAYVFRTSDGGTTYVEVAELTASDASADDNFGSSVAIAGGTIVVGSARDDHAWCTDRYDDDAQEAVDCNPGSVYVLRTTDGGATYVEVAKLTASDAAAGDKFGWSVAIDGDTVAISGGGSVYIFRTTDGGGTWSQVAKLVTSDGVSISRAAIAGDVVVAGAPYDDDDGYRSGSAYVFLTTDGGATYGQVAKLTAADAAPYDDFGYSVAIDGLTVVVGSPYDDDAGSYSGSAYVFLTTDGGATYDQVAKLTASDAAAGDYFGGSVAIAGGTVVVGSDNEAVYVFSSPAPTPQPTMSPKPTTPESSTAAAALGSDSAPRAGGTFIALLVAAALAL